MKAIALLVLPMLPMLWGCASEVPDTRERADSDYRHANSRIEATEEFELRKEMCAEAGGVLQVRRMSGSRQPPRVKEMRMATCALATNAGEAF
jgi:hypothetical protein